MYRPVTPRRTARRSALRHLVETFFDGSAEQAVAALLGGEARRLTEVELERIARGRLGRESGATAGRSVRRRVARRRAERKPRGRTAGGTVMSLLAVLTLKVSAILLLALTTTLLLRGSSAAARHWVLAVGVVSAAAVPALHVLPTPPVARMAPVGLLLLDALPLDSYVRFAAPADTDAVGSGVASRPTGPRPGRPRPVAAAVAGADVVGRVGRDGLAGGRGRRSRRASGRVGEAPMAPRVVEPGDGRAVASVVRRPRAVVRPDPRRRPPVGSTSGAGGDVGLAAARRHATGVGVRVVGGADECRAPARAGACAPR